MRKKLVNPRIILIHKKSNTSTILPIKDVNKKDIRPKQVKEKLDVDQYVVPIKSMQSRIMITDIFSLPKVFKPEASNFETMDCKEGEAPIDSNCTIMPFLLKELQANENLVATQ